MAQLQHNCISFGGSGFESPSSMTFLLYKFYITITKAKILFGEYNKMNEYLHKKTPLAYMSITISKVYVDESHIDQID